MLCVLIMLLMTLRALISCSGDTFTLANTLYVLGIKRNLIFGTTLAKEGFKVQFSDFNCSIYDRRDLDALMLSGTLYGGLYRLDIYSKSSASHDDALVASTSQIKRDTELWHARFGHLDFPSLIRRHHMVHVATYATPTQTCMRRMYFGKDAPSFLSKRWYCASYSVLVACTC